LQPVAGGQKLQWQQGQKVRLQLRSKVAIAATKDEKAVEQMKRDIEKGDVWDNEVVGLGLQVALVAGIVAVSIFIFNLGRPIVDNTLKSFPSPEQIQAYEDSK